MEEGFDIDNIVWTFENIIRFQVPSGKYFKLHHEVAQNAFDALKFGLSVQKRCDKVASTCLVVLSVLTPLFFITFDIKCLLVILLTSSILGILDRNNIYIVLYRGTLVIMILVVCYLIILLCLSIKLY